MDSAALIPAQHRLRNCGMVVVACEQELVGWGPGSRKRVIVQATNSGWPCRRVGFSGSGFIGSGFGGSGFGGSGFGDSRLGGCDGLEAQYRMSMTLSVSNSLVEQIEEYLAIGRISSSVRRAALRLWVSSVAPGSRWRKSLSPSMVVRGRRVV